MEPFLTLTLQAAKENIWCVKVSKYKCLMQSVYL